MNSRRKKIEKELDNLLKIDGLGSGSEAVHLHQIKIDSLRRELDREDQKVSSLLNFFLTLGNIVLVAMQILYFKK